MENRLIMLPQPILVSDEKIKGGDFYFKDGKVLQWVKGTSVTYTHVHPSNYPKPIIAGIEGLPKLNLSLIAEKIGWVDVEKLAKEYSGMRSAQSNSVDTSLHNARVAAFREGYKTNQSINEKKYSGEDIIQAVKMGREFRFGRDENDYTTVEFQKTLIDILGYLYKPKEYQVEIEVEINQCDGCISGHPIVDGIHIVPYPSGSMVCKKYLYDRPKITNNTIKVLKILK